MKLDLDETASIIGNSEQFYQIIRNLVENAIKYTPNEGEITISLTAAEKEITLKIANTGERSLIAKKKRFLNAFIASIAPALVKFPELGLVWHS